MTNSAVVNFHIGCPYGKEEEFRHLWQLGHKVVILDDVGLYPTHNYFEDYVSVKGQSASSISEIIQSWLETNEAQMGRIFTLADGSTTLCNQVAHWLGSSPISREPKLNLRDKFELRQKLSLVGLRIPFCVKVGPNDAYEVPNEAFPVVVKPVDSMASRNVKLVTEPDQLESALSDVFYCHTKVPVKGGDIVDVEEVYGLQGKAVIESFIVGKEFSLEVLVRNGKLALWIPTFKLSCGPPHFQEQGHVSGWVKFSELQEKNIKELLQALVAVHSYETCLLHVEIKVQDDDTVGLIECNSRMGGDGIHELVYQAYDISLLDLLLTLNVAPKVEAKAVAGRIFLITDRPGKLVKKQLELPYGAVRYYHDEGAIISLIDTERSARVGEVLLRATSLRTFEAYYDRLMADLGGLFEVQDITSEISGGRSANPDLLARLREKSRKAGLLFIAICSLAMSITGTVYLQRQHDKDNAFKVARMADAIGDFVARKEILPIIQAFRKFEVSEWAQEVVVTDANNTVLHGRTSNGRVSRIFGEALNDSGFDIVHDIAMNGIVLGKLWIKLDQRYMVMAVTIMVFVSLCISLLVYLLVSFFLVPRAFRDLNENVELAHFGLTRLSDWFEGLFRESDGKPPGRVTIDLIEKDLQSIKGDSEVRARILGNFSALTPKMRHLEQQIGKRTELMDRFLEMRRQVKELNQRATFVEKHAKLVSEITAQVAHDIRSPLSALKVLTQYTHSLPEDIAVLIKAAIDRIDSIANGLLVREGPEKKDQYDAGVYNLQTLIATVLAEKQFQHNEKSGVNIRYREDKLLAGCYSKVDKTLFCRALSNLINNALEALPHGKSGVVEIVLEQSDTANIISICDNGVGMPNHVLVRLGTKGFSHGKISLENGSGSGLGFYGAKIAVESCGGHIYVESEVNRGTTVRVHLPKSEMPEYAASSVSIGPDTEVIILDDDPSIHSFWSALLKEAKVLHYFRAEEAIKNLLEEVDGDRRRVYLFDYNLRGSKETGMDLVERFSLGANAYLVTGRHEDEELIRRIRAAGCKLVAKAQLATFKVDKSPSRLET